MYVWRDGVFEPRAKKKGFNAQAASTEPPGAFFFFTPVANESKRDRLRRFKRACIWRVWRGEMDDG